MGIKVIKPGLQTTIQDLGRIGYLKDGIAKSGAMDPNAMQLANWLVDNHKNHPVFEITILGPTLEFNCATTIAICGADFDLFLNDKMICNDQTIEINTGDILKFGKINAGARAYLAISADFVLPKIMNSYSTHLTASFGGYSGRALRENDFIQLKNIRQVEQKKLPERLTNIYSGKYLIRCVDSVETNYFSDEEKKYFYQQSFTVSPNSNRMGIRLDGSSVISQTKDAIVSSGLVQGSIQIPPSGLPIISSVDGQTIGGYPRIANIIEADLPLLGQLRAKDKINFSHVSTTVAKQILVQNSELIKSSIRQQLIK